MADDMIKKLRVGRKPTFDENDIDRVEKAINETLEECFEQGIHPSDALLQAKLGIRSDKYITRYRNGVAPAQRVPEIQDMFEQYKLIAQADLIQGGINKDYHPYFTSFILQNNHGMSTKAEVEQTGNTSITIENDL